MSVLDQITKENASLIGVFVAVGTSMVSVWMLKAQIAATRDALKGLDNKLDANTEAIDRVVVEKSKSLEVDVERCRVAVMDAFEDAWRNTEARVDKLDKDWRACLKNPTPICVSPENAQSIIRLGLTRNLHEMLSEYESSVLPIVRASSPVEPDRKKVERQVWRKFTAVAELTRSFFRGFEVASHNIAAAFDHAAPIEHTKESSRIEAYVSWVKRIVDITVETKSPDEIKRQSVHDVIEEVNQEMERQVMKWLTCSRESCGFKPPRHATGGGK